MFHKENMRMKKEIYKDVAKGVPKDESPHKYRGFVRRGEKDNLGGGMKKA
jgi:hypothetical protein